MGTGAVHLLDRVGVLTPKALLIDTLGPGEVGFITAEHQGDRRRPGRRHDHRRPQAGRRAAAGLPAEPAGRVLRHVPDRRRRLRQSARHRWASCASTMPASSTSPRAARPWASASAAAFSACCIWRSSRSGWSASSTSTSSSPHLRWSTGCTERRVGAGAAQPRRHTRSRPRSTTSRSRGSRPRSWCRTSISGHPAALHREKRGLQLELTYVGNRAMLVYQAAAQRGGLRLL